MKRKEQNTQLLAKLKESKQGYVSLVDPDCRLMKNRGTIEPCYNAITAVNSKNHLIIDYNVTNAPNDLCQLSSIAIGAKQTLGIERLDAIVDKAFLVLFRLRTASITASLHMCLSRITMGLAV